MRMTNGHLSPRKLENQDSEPEFQGGGSPQSMNCPDPSVWLEFTAGLRPEEARALLHHAAQCSVCAKELKEAIELLNAPQLDEVMQDLASVTPEWQQQMAQALTAATLTRSSGKAPTSSKVVLMPRRTWIGWRMYGSLAASLALVAVLIGIGWKLLVADNDARLLGKAYDAQRRTELRLPGGDAVPMASMKRGASDDDLPTEWLRIHLRTKEQLQKHPNDAYWHALMGRVELVADHGDKAEKEFNAAKALNENFPGLTADLAAAYFEIGSAKGDTHFFAQAGDLYGQAIDQLQGAEGQQSALAMAYFNRALCWERQSVLYQASKDFEQALSLEKDPGWRNEIQRRLAAVNELKNKSEMNRDPNADFSVRAFIAAERSNPATASMEYESYLGAATSGWLAPKDDSPETDTALRDLAEIGLAHKDAWLHDMLAIPVSSANSKATKRLVEAAQRNTHGDNDGMLREAKTASLLFHQSHSIPGMMRADAEMVYALQRTGKTEECLNDGKRSLQQPAVERYPWIRVYLLLETSACSFDRGSIDEAIQELEQAITLSRAAGLSSQLLRAQGFLVSAYSELGQTRAAWALSQEGLSRCSELRGARMATYQFLYSMYLAARAQGLFWTAAGIAEAANQASTFISNLPIQAYSYEELGIAETKIGHYEKAEAGFAKASTMLDSMPAGPTARLYRADWEVDRSDLLARQGHLQQALAKMRNTSQTALSTDNYTIHQKSSVKYAQLLLLAGNFGEALRLSVASTREAERLLSTTTGEVQRRAWERENSESYRVLVQCLVAMGRAEDALRAWEWYRSAPFRTLDTVNESGSSPTDLPPLPFLPASRRKGLTFVVARLENKYVVWSLPEASNEAIVMVVVAAPLEQVELIGNTLHELCSNRESAADSIRFIGGKLYTSLFGPFQNQIDRAVVLQVDLDPALRLVPISALPQPNGRYLGVEHSLLLLPAWWSVRPPPSDAMPSNPQTMLLEGAASVGSGEATSTLASEYLETEDIAKLYPRARLITSNEANSETVKKLLTSAELFHFNGHTAEKDHEVGIVLSNRGDVFSAHSLMGVSLKGCRLAVLATCSSTSGTSDDLEDMGSLTHALLLAGAGSVVGTLWDVDTRSSRELMLQFYKHLKQSASPAEALRIAQREISALPQTAHPFFWAAEEVFTQ